MASPNPASGSARLRLAPEPGLAGAVHIRVYDVSARLVRSLSSLADAARGGEWAWDGRSDRGDRVASGVYLVRAESSTAALVTRLTLMR